MPCDPIKVETPDGDIMGIVCTGRRRRRCTVCRKRWGVALCDAPLKKVRHPRKNESKTCDRSLCEECAIHREENIDVCPDHESWADALASQGILEGVL